jgi:glutamate synthase (NADPH/NADH) small chain
VETLAFLGERGVLNGLRARRLNWRPSPSGGPPQPEPIAGSEFEVECDLCLLAMGFLGSERGPMLDQLGIRLTERGNVWTDAHRMTSAPKVFAAGDQRRGQSLVVWAIAEGRSAARAVDQYLMGETVLPDDP